MEKIVIAQILLDNQRERKRENAQLKTRAKLAEKYEYCILSIHHGKGKLQNCVYHTLN
jgi:hypothetical protein